MDTQQYEEAYKLLASIFENIAFNYGKSAAVYGFFSTYEAKLNEQLLTLFPLVVASEVLTTFPMSSRLPAQR